MKKQITLIILLALLVSCASGCGGGGETPSDIVKAFYRAGNEGNYAKANSYMSVHFQAGMQIASPGIMPSFEEQMDAATKMGDITRIEITGGEKFGVGQPAMVYLTLYFRDGSQEKDIVTLRQEDERWKIVMSTWLMSAQTMELIR